MVKAKPGDRRRLNTPEDDPRETAAAIRRLGSDVRLELEAQLRNLLLDGPPEVRGACAAVLICYWGIADLGGVVSDLLETAVKTLVHGWSAPVESEALDMIFALSCHAERLEAADRAAIATRILRIVETGADTWEHSVVRLAAYRHFLQLMGRSDRAAVLRPESLADVEEILTEACLMVSEYLASQR